MSVSAKVEDGKIVQSNSATSLANSVAKDKSTLDKDAFLGLLVAQMKYQDPLQPTSNTEFVAQYAQFSSLEQMQNMSATLELSRASALVGKVVSINTTNSSGQAVQAWGKVEYVTYENNKAYVSVAGSLYSLDDVSEVVDQDYLDAYDLALDFGVEMNKLPSLENLTLDERTAIESLNKTYEGMSAYQKTFVASDYVTKLKEYTKRMEELVKDWEENNAGQPEDA